MSSAKTTKRDDKNIVVSFESDSEEASSSSEESSDEKPRQPVVNNKSTPGPAATAAAAASEPQQPAKSSRLPAQSSSESDDIQTSKKKQPASPAAPAAAAPAQKPAAAAAAGVSFESEPSSSDEDDPVPASKKKTSAAVPVKVSPPVETPPAPAPAPTKATSDADDAKPTKVVKKKTSSSKPEVATVNGNGCDQPDQAKESSPPTIEESAVPAKKKVTKTVKKSAKTSEAVENGVEDETITKAKGTTSEIINTKLETTENPKPAMPETTPTDPAPTAAKTTKKVVKKPKASATTNGDLEKTDDPVEKILDGKENKVTSPETIISKSEEVAKEPEVKEKLKKKRDSINETVLETPKAAAEEPVAKAGEVAEGAAAPTTKKVVKKKVKKVAAADGAVPSEETAATPVLAVPPPAEPPSAGEVTVVPVSPRDIEADREVMMLCDVTKDEEKKTDEVVKAASVEEIATVVEVSLTQPTNIDLNITPSITIDSTPAADPAADGNQKSDSDDVTKTLVNEESDYTFRRKSMDDFIKRILAEAREEQQKRMPSAATTSPTAADGASEAPPTGKSDDVTRTATNESEDQPLLDRRLASTDRKRIQTDADLGLTATETGLPSGQGSSSKKSGLLADLDLDDDLADIKGYFTKRNQQTSKLDSSLDLNDEPSLRSRTSTRLELIGADDGLSISQKILKDALPDEGSSYLSRIRQQQQQAGAESGLQREDSFTPRRREETEDIVRGTVRPVRALIDQQTEVIQQFKVTTRSIDDLETEIRGLREKFLDRQARIDSLRSAIDAETKLYDAEQTAANDRIKQQRIPGGTFVREDFMASLNLGVGAASRLPSAALGGASSLDLGFRSRSGSVSGASGLDLSLLSGTRSSSVRPSAADVGLRRSSGTTDVDDGASLGSTGYASSRFRRGGSMARDRTFNIEDLLGGGGTTSDAAGPTWSSRTTTTTTSSSDLPNFDVTSSYEPSRYQYGVTSSSTPSTSDYFRSPSSSSSYTTRSSLYGGTSGLPPRDPSRYGSTTTTSRFTTDTSEGTGSGGGLESSRFRRAQSVFDVSTPSYDSGSTGSSTGGYSSYVSTSRYGGGSSGSGTGGGEFHSKFLDKVRGNRSGEDSSSSGGTSGSGFKSRFLRSGYDSSSSKRY